jgi:hypothetical protein
VPGGGQAADAGGAPRQCVRAMPGAAAARPPGKSVLVTVGTTKFEALIE